MLTNRAVRALQQRSHFLRNVCGFDRDTTFTEMVRDDVRGFYAAFGVALSESQLSTIVNESLAQCPPPFRKAA